VIDLMEHRDGIHEPDAPPGLQPVWNEERRERDAGGSRSSSDGRDVPDHLRERDTWFQRLVLVALTASLFFLTGLLVRPLLPAITWSVALAVLGWPLHRAIKRAVRPWIAAALSTVLVALLIAGPGRSSLSES
jgi:hypothetical protein